MARRDIGLGKTLCLAFDPLEQPFTRWPFRRELFTKVLRTIDSAKAMGYLQDFSSSTMEDLASAAFAGQHETYLNCVGPAQILDRIKACFLSLWFDRAIAYRHQQHLFHL